MILFFGLMKEMKKWYRVGRDAPILTTSIKIFSLLQARDTELYDHLHTLGVEPQVFCIRWLRLLFLREFPINQVLECWDGIVTDGLELVEWVAVAMLVHIREEMLAGGYDVVMNLLMRYPPLKCSMPELLESAFLLKKRPVSRSSEISLSTPPMEQIKQILLHSVALLDDSSTISLVKAELQRAIAICDTDRTSTTEKKPLAMKKAVSLDRTAPMPFELVSFGSIDLKEQVRAGVSGINKAVQSLTATNIPSNHWLFSPKAPSKEH
jgi:hypothetical protein